jgi:hypothetical protein
MGNPAMTRHGTLILAQALVIIAVAPACRRSGYGPEDNPTTVRDVSGVEFAWSCTSNECEIRSLPTTPAPDACAGNDAPNYGWSWGRYFDVCSVCDPSDDTYTFSTTPGQCRVLACSTSTDCPVMFEVSPADVYECVGGLCENTDQARWPRTPLRRINAEELCFAVHDRAETRTPASPATLQVETDLDASCAGRAFDDVCSLPAGCRAP